MSETASMQQLAEQMKSASDYVKQKYSDLEQKYNVLEQHIESVEVQSKQWRPHGGQGQMETTSNPELAQFFQKGVLPGAESKELSVTNDGQGVTVRSEWSDRIVALVRETSPVRSVASNMQTSSNALEVLVDRGEVGSDWISELDERTKTAASFMERHKITVNEHYCLVEATLQMLEDSNLKIEQWLQGKIGQRFTRQENEAFLLGDGIGKPRGMLTYTTVPDADFTWGADPDTYEIGATFTGEAGDLTTAEPLFNLVDSLKAPYLENASWLMPRAFRNKVRKIKDLEGRYIFEPSLAAGVPDTLLGYPIVLAEDMNTPAADTTGALFGDFQQSYACVDRSSIDVIRDPYSAPGRVRWYARKRLGGAIVNPESVKALVLGTEPA
ncbi:phage major capsid protein [Halomonas sp. AOP42-A1-14]|uniref:phage major capsid protein n=1 Tax=Halomonas sp. AOP42-A1-14 TaxID=3457676 RepID=UPI0040347FF9